MENTNDNTGNRTRDFPTCSAVPQPNEPPRAPLLTCGALFYSHRIYPIMQFSFNALLYVNNKGSFTLQKYLLLQK
jgi:hypothetical protein